MLRFARQTDYGIVLLAWMARAPEGTPHSARVLARQAGLPAPTVSKVLKALARAGLLRSVRGARGGYLLARPARAITLDEVVTCLEGPIGVTACAPASTEPCAHEAGCPSREPMRRLNRSLAGALRRLTLLDLLPGGGPGPYPQAV